MTSWEVAPGSTIDLLLGDITEIAADAIVNAANSALAGGGGVDGAIHRAGGPAVMEDLERRHGRVGVRHRAVGSAVVSAAGRLPARWVIHAVGPVYRDGASGEADLLASAYQTSLRLADELGARHATFPAISTGVYGFPAALAAEIAVRALVAALPASHNVRRVTLVAFSASSLAPLQTALHRVRREAVSQP